MVLPIRLLVILPAPVDQAWSHTAAAAWNALQPTFRPEIDSRHLEIVRPHPVTSSVLQEQLSGKSFHIIHVIARGTSRPAARHGTITLVGSAGRARDLNAQNFAHFCASLSDLELVIIQGV